MRLLAVVQYDGTNYSGWQIQPDANSIQETIEKIISKILDTPTKIFASGRTDAGVHAFGQTFHFDTYKNIDVDKLKYGINSLLPKDIYILSLTKVKEDFNARYDVIQKSYMYVVSTQGYDVFNRNFRYQLERELDVNLMKDAASVFIGKHNFQNFTSKDNDEQNFEREIFSIQFGRLHENILIKFSGTGFMKYMVRMLVATLIEVGLGRLTKNDVEDLLNANPRKVVSYKAPAQGLYLESVVYDKD